MGKKRRQLPALLLVLGLCIGGYFGIRAYNSYAAEREKSAGEAARISLSDLGRVTILSFRNENGIFDFSKKEEAWSYSPDQDFPLRQSKLEGIVGALDSLTAVRSFEPGDSLSAYGLDQPAYTLTAADEDGKTLTLLFGGTTESNYYVMKQDGDLIYTVSSLLPSYLDCTLSDLVELETFPSVSEGTLVSIVLSSGADTLTLEKETVAAVTVPEGESGGGDSADVSAQPEAAAEYVWYASRDGSRAAVNDLEPASGESASDLMDTLLSKLSSLAFIGCETYKADERTRLACGLDSPALILTVNWLDSDGDTQSFVLAIGASNEAGNACYAFKDDSAAVNYIDAGLVSACSDVLDAFRP